MSRSSSSSVSISKTHHEKKRKSSFIIILVSLLIAGIGLGCFLLIKNLSGTDDSSNKILLSAMEESEDDIVYKYFYSYIPGSTYYIHLYDRTSFLKVDRIDSCSAVDCESKEYTFYTFLSEEEYRMIKEAVRSVVGEDTLRDMAANVLYPIDKEKSVRLLTMALEELARDQENFCSSKRDCVYYAGIEDKNNDGIYQYREVGVDTLLELLGRP